MAADSVLGDFTDRCAYIVLGDLKMTVTITHQNIKKGYAFYGLPIVQVLNRDVEIIAPVLFLTRWCERDRPGDNQLHMKDWRVVNPYVNCKGEVVCSLHYDYLTSLYKKRKSKNTIHLKRLICQAYHGSPPNRKKTFIIPIDGNRLNLDPSNLRWGYKHQLPRYSNRTKPRRSLPRWKQAVYTEKFYHIIDTWRPSQPIRGKSTHGKVGIVAAYYWYHWVYFNWMGHQSPKYFLEFCPYLSWEYRQASKIYNFFQNHPNISIEEYIKWSISDYKSEIGTSHRVQRINLTDLANEKRLKAYLENPSTTTLDPHCLSPSVTHLRLSGLKEHLPLGADSQILQHSPEYFLKNKTAYRRAKRLLGKADIAEFNEMIVRDMLQAEFQRESVQYQKQVMKQWELAEDFGFQIPTEDMFTLDGCIKHTMGLDRYP